MSHVTLYTHLIPSTPPTSRKHSRSSSGDSPPRGLRRIRGNIAGGGGAPISTTVVAPATPAPRRGSAHLHHPRQLRSSPKSAFFEDERRRADVLNGTALFAEHEPLSRPDSGGGVPLRSSGLGRVIGFEEVVRREEELDDTDSVAASTDDEDEGIALDDENDEEDEEEEEGEKRERLRVVKRDGKRVTPWATRASSFVSERPDSVLYTTTTTTGTTTSVVDRNEEQDTPDDRGLSEPAILDTPSSPSPVASYVTSPVASHDASAVASPVPSPVPSPAPSNTSSSSGDEIFLDAVETPLVEPPSPTFATTTTTRTEEETKRVILIYSPPADSTAPTIAPSLALIPATPLALSSSAEKEKQLGHPGSLGSRPISRRNTGIPTAGRAESIPENEALDSTTTTTAAAATTETSAPTRPSIAGIPEKVRESKLHPWWRPKNGASPTSSVEDLALPENSRFSEDLAPTARPQIARASTGNRNAKRIKGTKFVIEFVGWKRIGDAVLGKKLRRSGTAKEAGNSEREPHRPKTAGAVEGHAPSMRTTL
ncbi:hypothetical protein BZA05DRAFT_151431 [Tricharina praecox]|uniref:uncharacterized protein n=1 Tax=Tricharina praecox TaxID=43433 RepID=UPI00221EEB00|nr:uncharacterized protein BZA05DRAFT_151431 [Tricharina praecox]KAI5844834.1 hypothetical protein BZA05DRAFT_151431 [Tricharina praecox]